MTDFNGETLRYGFTDSPLGMLAVAQSAKGVAAIAIGDDRAKLRRELSVLLDGAALVEDEAGLADTLAAVADLTAHPDRRCDLPLDLRGSV